MLPPHPTTEVEEPWRLSQLAADIDHESPLLLIWNGVLAEASPPLNLLAIPDVSRLPCTRLRWESKLKGNFLARDSLAIYVNSEVLIEDKEPSSDPSLEFIFINCAADLELRQSDARACLFLGAGPIVGQDFRRVSLRVGKIGALCQGREIQSEMRHLFSLDCSDVNAVSNPESC